MSNCPTCNDSILNPQIGLKAYCIDCAQENQKCGTKFPAECVMYHLDTDSPSLLVNLDFPNKTSVSTILEKIDKLISTNFNIPITASNTDTVTLTASGAGKHTLKADVKLSGEDGNLIEIKEDGLFFGTTDLGKLKVNSTDTLDYLENQVIGETDGIVSISTPVVDGLLNILPDLNVRNLLTEIRTNYLNEFNTLLNSSTINNTNNYVTNMSSRLAPYIAYAYHGSVSNFDLNGRGLASNGYDKIYICNGSNGTPDYRGRSPIGANMGVPGSALDPNIDPTINGNLTITLNQKVGEFNHALTATEIAGHTHSLNDAGHFHYTVANAGDDGYLNIRPNYSIAWTSQHHNGNQDYDLVGNGASPSLGKTDTKSTGITINNNSGDQAHNNTQPSIGTIFIMFIP